MSDFGIVISYNDYVRRVTMPKKKKQEEVHISKEMEEKYAKVFDYEPTDEDMKKSFSPEFLKSIGMEDVY